MNTNRSKNKSSALKTRSEMEALIREIAGLRLSKKLLAATLDAEIQGVRGEYESRLTSLAETLAEKTETARAWAEANAVEFGHRKSLEFLHGVVGFRTGTPKLKTVFKRKWDDVLDALRSAPWGGAYIRRKEEINKEQIITAVTARVLSEAELREAGVQIVQEEAFFVDTKFTNSFSRETASAA